MKTITVIFKGNIGSTYNKENLICHECKIPIKANDESFLIISDKDGNAVITHDAFKCYVNHYQ